jgi:hypothetical protein
MPIAALACGLAWAKAISAPAMTMFTAGPAIAMRNSSHGSSGMRSSCATAPIGSNVTYGVGTPKARAMKMNPKAVTLLVQAQLVARIDVGALESRLDRDEPDILGVGILNQRLESWKSVRAAATAPMLVEKGKPVPRAELLQSERRAFLSHGIDPVGDREFGRGCPAML